MYDQKGCSSCHGLRGEGGIGPALATITAGETKGQIAQRMWNHAPVMRERMGSRRIPWPRVTPDELAALIHYLSRGWKPDAQRQGSSSR